MRTLSQTLLAEQKKPSRKPVIKVEVQEYDHPQGAGEVLWSGYSWHRLYDGSEDKTLGHGCCISGDGSLHRIRTEKVEPDVWNIFYSRVQDPGPASDFSQWQYFGIVLGNEVALVACGSEVMMFAFYEDDQTHLPHLMRRESSDNGAIWGAWIYMSDEVANPSTGVALAFNPVGDCAVIYGDSIPHIIFRKRVQGSWQSQHVGPAIESMRNLTMWYEGDWNIVNMDNLYPKDRLRPARIIYGDGYRVPHNEWGTNHKIPLDQVRMDDEYNLVIRDLFRAFQKAGINPCGDGWEVNPIVLSALAGEPLEEGHPSLIKPTDHPFLLSIQRDDYAWLFIHGKDADFSDLDWEKARKFGTYAPYGLALTFDGNYIWATQADEVWRSLYAEWEATPGGSGAGDKFIIASSTLLRIAQSVDPEQQSELEMTLDNSGGEYKSPGSGDLALLKKGSRVNLHIGYRTSSDELSECGRYFVESWDYGRADNRATFTLRCIDAWGLLARYRFNKPIIWNAKNDDYTCYQLIELVMQAVGGTLSYKSRSNVITSSYPLIEVRTAESGAGVLLRLLSLVPDVIFFFGLDAFIVHPQETDDSVYSYGQEHVVLDGQYGSDAPEINRIYIIGRDRDGNPVFGEATDSGDVDLVGERLDFHVQQPVHSQTMATNTAQSVISKMRLTRQWGSITVPPNCGQELWDVIDVTDSLCARSSAKYRVVGTRLTYEQSQAKYLHRLILGGV